MSCIELAPGSNYQLLLFSLTHCFSSSSSIREFDAMKNASMDWKAEGDADFIKDSLENGKFYHRFCNETFIPLVQPLDIEDPSKAIEAEFINASMKPSMILALDAALWKKWKPIAETVDNVSADALAAFFTFLYNEYFRTMKEVQTQSECIRLTSALSPQSKEAMLDLSFFAILAKYSISRHY